MSDTNFEHEDILHVLNQSIPLKEKLILAHQSLRNYFPFIARIAVTLYDPDTGLLKTYLNSSDEKMRREHYQSLLKQHPSLLELIRRNRPRVINHMVTNETSDEHQRRLGREGYASSYTMPLFDKGEFFGFLFFNSHQSDVFREEVLCHLDIIGHLMSLLVLNELEAIRILSAAVKTTEHITHVRDPETGSHLDRMSRYSRLIALKLADKYELDDVYIEHVFMFAPLHDIGKIGIPDSILLKNDALDEEERTIMRSHARKGREIIDELLQNFGLDGFEYVDVLRNIAEFHHEAVNGTGYPSGMAGEQIPLEARIVAVADVFDALTSQRPYKAAWNNDEAFATLQKLAGESLDRECVEVLIAQREEVEKIQEQFAENRYG